MKETAVAAGTATKRSYRISFGHIEVGASGRRWLEQALDRNWVSEGPNVKRFEEEFARKFPTSLKRYAEAVEIFPSGVTHDSRFLNPFLEFLDVQMIQRAFQLYREALLGLTLLGLDVKELVNLLRHRLHFLPQGVQCIRNELIPLDGRKPIVQRLDHPA